MTFKVLGTAKVSQTKTVTLVELAYDLLDVTAGEIIVFYQNELNQIVIKAQKHGSI